MSHWTSRESQMEKKRKEEEEMKKIEAMCADFKASAEAKGKSVHIGYANRAVMEKVNRRQMRNESPAAVERKIEKDDCLLFGPDGKIKDKWL